MVLYCYEYHFPNVFNLSLKIPSYEEVKFETASLLTQIYEKQVRVVDCPVLRVAVDYVLDLKVLNFL